MIGIGFDVIVECDLVYTKLHKKYIVAGPVVTLDNGFDSELNMTFETKEELDDFIFKLQNARTEAFGSSVKPKLSIVK